MFGNLTDTAWEIPTNPDDFQIEVCGFEDDTPRPPICPPLVSQARPPLRVRCLVWQVDAPMRQYRPIKAKESLYRTLAAVVQTPDGVLEFARMYGRLGLDAVATRPDGQRATVERLDHWNWNIGLLAEAIRLWDLAQYEDRKTLAKSIVWRKNAVWLKQSFREDVIPDDSAFTPGDLVAPAKHAAIGIVNNLLDKSARPLLFWDNRQKKAVLRYIPRTLLGAVALQFATAMTGGRESRVCPVCGRYFEVTAQASRNDRLTCSNRCRVRAYRERQQKAQDLHVQGRTLKQISKEIGSDISTIKTWINKKG